MATKTADNKQTIKDGTLVEFVGYEEGLEPGDLSAGMVMEVTGYDPEENLYNVKDAEGNEDSLSVGEFKVLEDATTVGKKTVKKASAPKKKASAPKKKAVKEEEEVEEEEVEEVEAEEEVEVGVEAEAEVEAEVEEEVRPTPSLPKYKKTVSVAKALKAHNGDVLDAAHAMAEQKEKTVWTLGGLLALVKRGNLQAELVKVGDDGEEVSLYSADLKGFNAYVSDELGVSPRTADYYVNLYERFSQITNEAQITKVGWTKLRELLPLKEELTSESVGQWLEDAKTSTTAELHDKVTKHIVENGVDTRASRNTATVEVFRLVAPQDMAANWHAAFDLARQEIGSEADVSACADHIITQWYSIQAAPAEGQG